MWCKYMKKNKLIIFDWGNVVESHITGYTGYDAINDLFEACGYTKNEGPYVTLDKLNLFSIKDLKGFEKIYNEVIKPKMNLNKTFDEYLKLQYEIFDNVDYYKDVANYEVSLKDKCYIAILSNLYIYDKERLNKELDLSKYDYLFLSCDMGLEKPNDNIYEEVQKLVPFKPEDILFIDDRMDNLKPAQKLGWNTLQATGLELDLIKEKCEKFINS